MKAREKDVEREVAKYLSQVFVRWGARPVERIPVPFREGPDLTVEPSLKLVIDVKSRLEIPQGLSAPEGKLVVWNQMIGVRLRDIDLLWGESEPLTRAMLKRYAPFGDLITPLTAGASL
jgi:hypothetical protein